MEQLITEVHSLSDSCEFGEMKEDLIRDRLVVGSETTPSTSDYKWNQTSHWMRPNG